MVEAIGTCYEDAWRFLIKEEEGELIHGTVESLGRRIGHAWVELPTGFIWEPESRRFIKKADFEAMAKPQEETRYSVTEAAIMLARVGKHGPWIEEERAMWLKSGNPVENRLEPWQMTQDEFVKVYLERFKRMLSKEAFAQVTPEELQKEREEAIDYQEHTIKQALATGKLVPPEVLRDYPKFGEAIAKELNLKYEGIQEELGMQFTDIHGTGTTFYATSVEDARERLREKRRLFREAEGGNPMRTEAQRKATHERIFGKGAIPPLERLGRGQIVNDLMPMSPEQGPPLPRSLGIRWPWRKQ